VSSAGCEREASELTALAIRMASPAGPSRVRGISLGASDSDLTDLEEDEGIITNAWGSDEDSHDDSEQDRYEGSGGEASGSELEDGDSGGTRGEQGGMAVEEGQYLSTVVPPLLPKLNV
jgi:hypothetical protein